MSRKTKGTPDEIDVYVGQKIKTRRSLLGLSQEKLGEAVGLTFQQIQKYERGHNRVAPGRLWKIAKALGVSVIYFFPPESGDLADPTYDLLTENKQLRDFIKEAGLNMQRVSKSKPFTPNQIAA